MLKSMTGYGKASAQLASATVTLEIRALNSKQLDLNTRIPMFYREKEAEIRSEITKALERGKIDLSLTLDSAATSENIEVSINRDMVKKYFNELKAISGELGMKIGSEVLPAILQMPDVQTDNRTTPTENDWEALKNALNQALAQTDAFRVHEGELLGRDMQQRIEIILQLLSQVEPYEKARIESLRERFTRNRDEFLEKIQLTEKLDENRFEQEIFWYLEKLDITEEKVRLQKHCDYFIENLHSEVSNGRKLGFVAQEIGREINTLGSKAYDAELQKIVVQMKDELEKIKEQIGNIL